MGSAWASKPSAANRVMMSVRMRSIMRRRPLGRPECGGTLAIEGRKAKGKFWKCVCGEWANFDKFWVVGKKRQGEVGFRRIRRS